MIRWNPTSFKGVNIMGRVYMLDGPIWAWRELYLKTSENHTKTGILTALNMLTSNVLFYN